MPVKTLIHKKSSSFIPVRKKVKYFKLGELFCGPGGLALGAISSKLETDNTIYGINHVWANDYDNDSCETYKNNLHNGKSGLIICEDVRKLDINRLTDIDAFAYGFPCNDFSIVGKQKGIHGNYGPLYLCGVNVINKFKPRFFVAENVGGISSANDGKAFKKIISDLEDAGNKYNLTVHLYKAEEYGIPQTRHRIIIVGIDKQCKLYFKVPAPTTINCPKTAREAIENPPISKNAYNNEYTKQSKTVIERLKYICAGENAWTAKLPERLKLNVRGAKLSQIYKRLHPDKPSYTITGSGGGGTHGYHWKYPRALTNRERARIQTFPDHYYFSGSKESVRKQIGMAVPPKLSKIIFVSILKTFAGIKYPCVQANLESQMTLFKADY